MKLDSSSPLLYGTPSSWAPAVSQEPRALLSDQAYLEKKAANNALEFLNLWPGSRPSKLWLSAVSRIARDETTHLQQALKLLLARGGALAPTHKNPYAADLGRHIRKGKGRQELMDRLLISALIEARSCERFIRLTESTSIDLELAGFYSGLVGSESGHYRLFLDLAREVLPEKEVETRWKDLLEKEAQIIQDQPKDFRIHSGA